MHNKTVHRNKQKDSGLRKLTEGFVILAIFFIPFNSYKGISFLGEFAKESAVIFLLLATLSFAALIFVERKIAVPINNIIFKVLLLVVGWFFLSTLINYPTVSTYFFKNTSGINRFIRQYFVLVFSSIVVFLVYYNVFRSFSAKRILLLVRKTFLFSLIIVSIYGALEIAILLFGMGFLMPLLEPFSYFPFTEVKFDYNLNRISSVTFEPPALATYLLTIAGWMFSYIITEKGWLRFLPALAVITLTLFSGSRGGMAIVAAQSLLFFILLIKNKKHHKLAMRLTFGVIIIIGLLLVFKGKVITEYIVEKATSFDKNDDTHNISNKSRFGIQEANYQVFLNNPIIGVGYGQQSFEAKKLYPYWAKLGNWEFDIKYLNRLRPNFPPGYNLYTRIMAESGLIGIIFFVFFIFVILATCIHLLRKQDVSYILGVILLISFVGFFINWYKSDTFRVFGFWLSLAILVIVAKDFKFTFKSKLQ